MSGRVAVLGATGKAGRRLVADFVARGWGVVAVGRDPARLATLAAGAERRIADFADAAALRVAVADADHVLSAAHAKFTGALLAALPDRDVQCVLMGSVRRYLPIYDRDGAEIAAAEELFYASGRSGVMIHKSLIYTGRGDNNVERILRLIARFPAFAPVILPLPDGGRRLVQPIHADDVVACLAAAIERRISHPPLIAAGPVPISYADMARICGQALGRRVRIAPIPTAALASAAELCAKIGLRLPLNPAELRRAGADKSFDVGPMRQILGVAPRPFTVESLDLSMHR